MREKLIQYVDLLFAGADCSGEAKQEILQNTLDRYDDLVAQGKPAEAAYRLAISGIGDIGEILGGGAVSASPVQPERAQKKLDRKLWTGIAIGLYILCPVSLFIFQNELGLSLLLVVVAIATGILIMVGGDKAEEVRQERSGESELKKSVSRLVSAVTLVIYLAVSFATGAWYITWILFPISGAVRGLIRAVMDLKEANHHEA